MTDEIEERRRSYRMSLALAGKAGKRFDAIAQSLSEVDRNDLLWVSSREADVVARCSKSDPDILLLDVDLCGDHTLNLLRQIKSVLSCPVLLLTTSLQKQRHVIFSALGAGAYDVIEVPETVETVALSAMLHKMHHIARLTIRERRKLNALDRTKRPECNTDMLVAIGASTGGPAAVVELLSALPKDFAAAVIVVLHVDVRFAPGMAAWMDSMIPLPVRLACEGNRPKVGEVLLASTNEHLVMSVKGVLHYTPEPVDYPYRPSADVFFHSLVQHWQGRAIGILLSGMGRDGAIGLLAMRRHGWPTIAQDEKSSVIYGMPKAAAQIDAASKIMALDSIGPELVRLIDNSDKKSRAVSVCTHGGNHVQS